MTDFAINHQTCLYYRQFLYRVTSVVITINCLFLGIFLEV